MFRRLFWLVMGAGFGFGMSFWVTRRLKETAARYAPERITNDISSSVRGFGSDVRTAVAEGRLAMREREAELRARSGRA